VTSSNPSIGGVLTGLGIAPNKLGAVIGVVSFVALVVVQAQGGMPITINAQEQQLLHCGSSAANRQCSSSGASSCLSFVPPS